MNIVKYFYTALGYYDPEQYQKDTKSLVNEVYKKYMDDVKKNLNFFLISCQLLLSSQPDDIDRIVDFFTNENATWMMLQLEKVDFNFIKGTIVSKLDIIMDIESHLREFSEKIAMLNVDNKISLTMDDVNVPIGDSGSIMEEFEANKCISCISEYHNLLYVSYSSKNIPLDSDTNKTIIRDIKKCVLNALGHIIRVDGINTKIALFSKLRKEIETLNGSQEDSLSVQLRFQRLD